MKFKKLNHPPKTPQTFIREMFKKLKRDPDVRFNNDYLRVDKELMDKALIECAYGFFWVSKDKKVISKNFF